MVLHFVVTKNIIKRLAIELKSRCMLLQPVVSHTCLVTESMHHFVDGRRSWKGRRSLGSWSHGSIKAHAFSIGNAKDCLLYMYPAKNRQVSLWLSLLITSRTTHRRFRDRVLPDPTSRLHIKIETEVLSVQQDPQDQNYTFQVLSLFFLR